MPCAYRRCFAPTAGRPRPHNTKAESTLYNRELSRPVYANCSWALHKGLLHATEWLRNMGTACRHPQVQYVNPCILVAHIQNRERGREQIQSLWPTNTCHLTRTPSGKQPSAWFTHHVHCMGMDAQSLACVDVYVPQSSYCSAKLPVLMHMKGNRLLVQCLGSQIIHGHTFT